MLKRIGAGLLPVLLQIGMLLVGCYSVAGAFFSMLLLEVNWSVMIPAIGCLCVLLYFVIRTKSSVQTRIYLILLWCGYGLILLQYRSLLLEKLEIGLQGFFSHLNQTFHMYIALLPETESVNQSIDRELLLILFPLLLLTGYGIMRRRSGIPAAVYGGMLVTACVIQVFPENIYLLGMLLSLSSCIARPVFAENEAAGRKTALISVFLCGVVYLVAEQVQPGMNTAYEKTEERRIQFFRMVNDEWLPAVEERFNWKAMLHSSTVGGSLEQEDIYYTSARLYRVTLDEKPKEVLYLKGFVGDIYTGTTWLALGDEALESYYQEKGWEVPEEYTQIVNWTWKLARAQQYAKEQRHSTGKLDEELLEDCPQIEIEEIGGRNDYSLYPYGTRLEDGTVHADGSQERNGQVCKYDYQSLSDYDGRAAVSIREGEQNGYGYYMEQDGVPHQILGESEQQMWEHYRQYVYDTYLEVPQEQLPGLLEWTREQKFPIYNGENIWQVTRSTLRALEQTARYHLAEQEVLEGEDYIEAFLLRRREGYCTHFASAEVMLLRLLGIPARYTAGYCASPQDFEEREGKFVAEVLDRQAHAWVEIYIDELGWVPLEATPGDVALAYDNRLELVTRVSQMSGNSHLDGQNVDSLTEEPELEDVDEGEELSEPEETQKVEPAEDEEELPDSAEKSWMESTGHGWLTLSAGIGLLLVILFFCLMSLLVRRLRQLIWRRKWQGESTEALRQLYTELLRMLAMGADFTVSLEECTSEEASDQILAVVPEIPAGELTVFLRLTEECVFGRRKPSAEELETGYELCRKIYRQLMTGKLCRRRLVLWFVSGNLFP